MLDFKLSGNLLSSNRGDVGDGDEPRAWHQPPDVLGVASPHFPNAEHPDS
jgi:hypothetical protein